MYNSTHFLYSSNYLKFEFITKTKSLKKKTKNKQNEEIVRKTNSGEMEA